MKLLIAILLLGLCGLSIFIISCDQNLLDVYDLRRRLQWGGFGAAGDFLKLGKNSQINSNINPQDIQQQQVASAGRLRPSVPGVSPLGPSPDSEKGKNIVVTQVSNSVKDVLSSSSSSDSSSSDRGHKINIADSKENQIFADVEKQKSPGIVEVACITDTKTKWKLGK